MQTSLKREITDYIFDNIKYFSLHENTVDKFTLYIFDDKGEYLIGGQEVKEFIDKAIRLLQES